MYKPALWGGRSGYLGNISNHFAANPVILKVYWAILFEIDIAQWAILLYVSSNGFFCGLCHLQLLDHSVRRNPFYRFTFLEKCSQTEQTRYLKPPLNV